MAVILFRKMKLEDFFISTFILVLGLLFFVPLIQAGEINEPRNFCDRPVEEMSIQMAYVCNFGGDVKTAHISVGRKRGNCNHCNARRDQFHDVGEQLDNMVKVKIVDADQKMVPIIEGTELAKRFSGNGLIEGPGDGKCSGMSMGINGLEEQDCSVGNASMFTSAGVIQASAHTFFDYNCRAMNGNEKEWWKGFIFKIRVNGEFQYFEIENGEAFTRCPSQDVGLDVVILKLKNMLVNKKSEPLVTLYDAEPYTEKLHEFLLDNPVLEMGSYHGNATSPGFSQRTETGWAESFMEQKYVNNIGVIGEFKGFGKESVVRYMGNTLPGASGGPISYFHGERGNVAFLFHRGGGRGNYNEAVPITQEMIDVAHRFHNMKFEK